MFQFSNDLYFKIFCRFLLEQGANVSAVNNDGELAIDISESDEMEELLQKEIDKQGMIFQFHEKIIKLFFA